MPFVQARCTNCGGDIQLDDSRESGFCTYCGAKVVFKEAVQKLELSGKVAVDGIATLEKLLANAATFKRLGDTAKMQRILEQITDEYPEDHRAWLLLAENETKLWCAYDSRENKYGELDPFNLSKEYDMIGAKLRSPLKNINNALLTAPESKRDEIKREMADTYRPYLSYFQGERDKLRNYEAYVSASDAALARANAAYESSVKAHRAIGVALNTIATLMIAISFLLAALPGQRITLPMMFVIFIAIILFVIDSCVCKILNPALRKRVYRASKPLDQYRREQFALAGIPYYIYAEDKYASFFGSRPVRLTLSEMDAEAAFWEKTVAGFESAETEKVSV